jgi:hypothetical protein
LRSSTERSKTISSIGYRIKIDNENDDDNDYDQEHENRLSGAGLAKLFFA